MDRKCSGDNGILYNTAFLPILSAKRSAIGVKKIPGNVNALISKATADLFRSRACEILGNAGVRLATPMTPISVILKALDKTGLHMKDRPRLLSDNGSCYVSGDLKEFLEEQAIDHVRGKPQHPQTQGKIERYHRTMKNIIRLDYHYSPEELENQIAAFVDYYNNHRYHESLDNLTPAGVYFGRKEEILERRQRIKNRTLLKRKMDFELRKAFLNE
jgi:hypothetical protein